MRDYQPSCNNPYYLPATLYKRVLATIRDYSRMRSECNEILFSTPEHNVGSCAHKSSPTENKGIKLALLNRECEAIEKGFIGIPKEYHKGIMDNICRDQRFPIDADRTTYSRWKHKFIYQVAINLGYL